MSKGPASQVVDVSDIAPPLWVYVFKKATGTPVLSGYFVKTQGVQVGGVASIDIDALSDDTCTFLDLYRDREAFSGATEIPDTIIGFVGKLSGGTLYVGQGSKQGSRSGVLTDVTEVPTSDYPILSESDLVTFGRIG